MVREELQLKVGFFALGALISLLYGWGWLKNLSLESPQVFWVRFHDVAGLSNNATINVQGVRVGNVDQISFKLPEGLQDAPDADADDAKLPKVYIRLKVTGLKLKIPKASDITIQTLGLVGAKYIEITLPSQTPGPVEAVNPQVVVDGHDPVRTELVLNNIAKKINLVADAISSDEASAGIKHFSQAAAKLDKNLDRLPDLEDSIKLATTKIGSTASRFGKTADKAERMADNASRFFEQGSTLASGLNNTNRKVSKILDNPNMTKDLKETVQLANKTAQTVQSAMNEFSSTVKDKELRQDLMTMLGKIQNSSEEIRKSMNVVNKLADDQGLRSDMKTALQDAKEAMSKANTIMSDPSFRADVSQTMARVKTAASDIDVAAQQLHQILGKRAPLLHMMFGKPGELSRTKETLQDGTSVNATTGVPN